MPNVVIVDDHEIVIKGLTAVITQKPGWHVVGYTTDPTEVLSIIKSMRPDIAILDYRMGEVDGVELTRQALSVHPDLTVLIFTMHYNDAVIRDALLAGARGFVLKSDMGSTLDAALEAIAAGQPFLPGPAANILLRSFLGKKPEPQPILTVREREVMKLIALGYSGKQIAQKLEISPKTVEVHRTAVLRKLNLRNLVDIVRYAVRNGIIDA